jgi:hypothetical protein
VYMINFVVKRYMQEVSNRFKDSFLMLAPLCLTLRRNFTMRLQQIQRVG